MNILITGSSGFVGTHLCNHFTQTHKVIRFDLPQYDITDSEDVLGMLDPGVDAVIHLAAQVRIDRAIEKPYDTLTTNVEGTINVLEACRLNDVPKLLFASSSDIYGTARRSYIDEWHPLLSENPYGASKIAGEALCRAYGKTYGIDVGILRCFNIYGPGQTGGVIPLFVKKAMKGEPLTIHGAGRQCRDYVYVDDIVNAYDIMLQKSGWDAVNFGTGIKTSVRDLAETILCVTGSLSPLVFTGVEERSTYDLIADYQRARQVGWNPKVTLKEGIQNVMESLK